MDLMHGESFREDVILMAMYCRQKMYGLNTVCRLHRKQ